MTPLLSPKTSGELPGKQIRKGLRLGGSKCVLDANKSCSVFAGRDRLRQARGLTPAESGRAPATTCFLLLPPCFPGFPQRVGEAKNGPEGPF